MIHTKQNININKNVLLFGLFLAFQGVFCLLILEPNAGYIVFPMLVLVNIALFFLAVLMHWEKSFPLFELGVFFVAATTVYSIYPLFSYLLNGLQWTIYSDGRLRSYHANPAEIGGFAWRHILYLLSFVLTYIYVRGKKAIQLDAVEMSDRSIIISVVMVFFCIITFFWIFRTLFEGGPCPYLFLQIAHNLATIKFIMILCIMMFLFQRWKQKKWRYLFLLWFFSYICLMIYERSGRTWMFLLLLSATLMYHRVVRPITLRQAVLGAFMGFVGFLFYGYGKHHGFSDLSFITAANEFEALLGTSYDLHMRKTILHSLPNIPWQLYVSDLLLLIPSQLLPFYKWDPSQWYLEVIGFREKGVGFMFGVISQAIIGFDWYELILRGSLLGFICAKIHRWYMRHSRNFWINILYIFLCVKIYYTFRASSFYIVYFVVYGFIAALIMVSIIRFSLTEFHRTVIKKEGLSI